MSADRILSFAEFRLDPVAGHLYRKNERIPLAPKAFALLEFLAGQAGRLVSKQELLGAVWPNVFVGDAVLKGTIRELRKALGDDSHEPRFIETAHRRGYRFIPHVTVIDARTTTATAAAPRVSYTRSGDVNIAYQVVGSGPIDIVFVMGWVSHLEYFWNEPSFAAFLTRLASMAQVDPVRQARHGPVGCGADQRAAVARSAHGRRAGGDGGGGQPRAVLMGVSEGGPLCTLFAATHPEMTAALVMIGSYARRLWAPDYPWGPTVEERDRFCQTIIEQWGGPVGIDERAPSRALDPEFRSWWSAYLRMGASPGAAVALTRMNAEVDIRDVLPKIRVPALVIHRTGDQCLKIEEGRYLAEHIPGATMVELPGDDHLPFVGDQVEMLSAIDQFLAKVPRVP